MALVLLAAAVALLVTAGAVLALEGPGAIDVTPVEALVTAVLVTLVAVAVGLGRRRLPDLVVVALPVLLVLALAAWIGPPMRGGFGSRNVRPADVRELDRTYHLAAGTLVLDLGGIDFGTGSRRVSASVAMGRLHVVVPDQVTVVVDAHVDAGEARVFGVRDTGTGVSRTTTDRAGRGTLHLRTDVGFGQVVVERASEQTTSLGARSARVAADVAA